MLSHMSRVTLGRSTHRLAAQRYFASSNQTSQPSQSSQSSQSSVNAQSDRSTSSTSSNPFNSPNTSTTTTATAAPSNSSSQSVSHSLNDSLRSAAEKTTSSSAGASSNAGKFTADATMGSGRASGGNRGNNNSTLIGFGVGVATGVVATKWLLNRGHASERSELPGEDRWVSSAMKEFGASMMQIFRPLHRIHQHLSTVRFYNGDLDRQVVTHQYVSHLNEEVAQSLVYDSDSEDARLIGVEYVISKRLFDRLPADEKALWYSRDYEAKSGVLAAPGVPNFAERGVMSHIGATYGKTWHFWQVDRGDALPFGTPKLMMSLTRDGQIQSDVRRAYERYLGSSISSKRDDREGLNIPTASRDANSWMYSNSRAFQIPDSRWSNSEFSTGPIRERAREFKEEVADQAHVMGDRARGMANIARERVPELAENAKEKAVDVYENVKDKTSDVIDTAKDRAAHTYENVKDKTSDTIEVVKDKAAHTYENVKDKAADTIEVVKDKAAHTYENVKDKAADTIEVVKDKTADTLDKAAHTYENVKDKAVDTIEVVKDKAADAIEVVKDKAADLYENAKDTATHVYEVVKDKASDVLTPSHEDSQRNDIDRTRDRLYEIDQERRGATRDSGNRSYSDYRYNTEHRNSNNVVIQDRRDDYRADGYKRSNEYAEGGNNYNGSSSAESRSQRIGGHQERAAEWVRRNEERLGDSQVAARSYSHKNDPISSSSSNSSSSSSSEIQRRINTPMQQRTSDRFSSNIVVPEEVKHDIEHPREGVVGVIGGAIETVKQTAERAIEVTKDTASELLGIGSHHHKNEHTSDKTQRDIELREVNRPEQLSKSNSTKFDVIDTDQIRGERNNRSNNSSIRSN